MIKTPIFLINFKNYSSTLGKAGLDLAMALDKIAKKSHVSLVLAVNPVVIDLYSKQLDCAVISQQIDPFKPGACTGRVIAESLKLANCEGSLVNHSEIPMGQEDVIKVLNSCKQNFLQSFLCVESLEEARRYTMYDPSFICFEDKSLIGGNVSVASENPTEIKEMAEALEVPVLVGAGIKTSLDVKKSISLGADGILVASAITKSNNPIEAFKDLLSGFN